MKRTAVTVALLLLVLPGISRLSMASDRQIDPPASVQEQRRVPGVLTEEPGKPKRLDQRPANRKMSSRLSRMVSGYSALRKKRAKLSLTKRERRLLDSEEVRVILHTKAGIEVDLDEIEARGAKILRARRNLIGMEVPVSRIGSIVDHVEGIEYARLPHRLFPAEVISEGVDLTGGSGFHDADYRGAGVKVAVIDVGFKGLTEAQASGDLPQGVITHDYTGNGLLTEYLHGTACAEIVHDMAPDAELHLLKIRDEIDIYNAYDYCVGNGIDIISFSLGTFGSGPGDGTGPLSEAADSLREDGILFVAAAGNHGTSGAAGSHWKGAFSDSDGDGIHEFVQGDAGSERNRVIASPSQDDDGNSETNEVTVVMRWNDWPNANVDFDFSLYDFFSGQLVDASTTLQDGSQPPLEVIVVDLPDSQPGTHLYNLAIVNQSGGTGIELELYLGGTADFIAFDRYTSPIATSESSIVEPADAEGVLTVGAINYNNWASGPQEAFSSQGPTNAWAGSSARVKPDIGAADGVSGSTYGKSAFYGTSAATPHVAGAAALVLSMHPNLNPDDLQTAIESMAVDRGEPGKDSIYGSGWLDVDPYNNLPTFTTIGSKVVDEGDLLAFSISASDADGDDLSYSATSLPPGANFDADTRVFTWTPNGQQEGQYRVRFEVSDGLNPAFADVMITVAPNPPNADLTISTTVGSPAPRENSTVFFTVLLRNNGPNDISDAIVTCQLPSGVSYVSDDAGLGSYDPITGLWTVGELSRNRSAELMIRATIDTDTLGSIIAHSASVSSSSSTDPDDSNNNSSIDIFVAAENPGDVDNNGSIDAADVSLIMDIIFGTKTPTSAEFARANTDTSDLAVDIADLLTTIDMVSAE